MNILDEEKRTPDYFLDVAVTDGVLVVTVEGWLDETTLPCVTEAIEDHPAFGALKSDRPGVLDFRHVTFLAPAAVPMLRRLKKAGWELLTRSRLVAALLDETDPGFLSPVVPV